MDKGYGSGEPVAQGQPGAYGQPGGYQQQSYAPSDVVVVKPQAYVPHTGVRPMDYLILSIISVFFCWPMAICAIMYSLNSRNAADINDYARAECEGHTARNIAISAIVFGMIIIGVSVGVSVTATTYYCYER